MTSLAKGANASVPGSMLTIVTVSSSPTDLSVLLLDETIAIWPEASERYRRNGQRQESLANRYDHS